MNKVGREIVITNAITQVCGRYELGEVELIIDVKTTVDQLLTAL